MTGLLSSAPSSLEGGDLEGKLGLVIWIDGEISRGESRHESATPQTEPSRENVL